MKVITDNLIWGIGTLATIALALLRFFGFIDWSWWAVAIPYYVLAVWMLAYLSMIQLTILAAIGTIWAGALVPLKLFEVVSLSWWLIILPWIGLGLISGALSRRKPSE